MWNYKDDVHKFSAVADDIEGQKLPLIRFKVVIRKIFSFRRAVQPEEFLFKAIDLIQCQ